MHFFYYKSISYFFIDCLYILIDNNGNYRVKINSHSNENIIAIN